MSLDMREKAAVDNVNTNHKKLYVGFFFIFNSQEHPFIDDYKALSTTNGFLKICVRCTNGN